LECSQIFFVEDAWQTIGGGIPAPFRREIKKTKQIAKIVSDFRLSI